MENTDPRDKLIQIFMPYMASKISYALANKSFFVHYTSAANAISIIRNQEVWLRNSRLMNDFREIQHGQDCLYHSWNDTSLSDRLTEQIEFFRNGLSEEIVAMFNKNEEERDSQSFILSLSEHGDSAIHESDYGRLSMWRAYGGDTNVAFVFRSEPLLADNAGAEGPFLVPVMYATPNSFKNYLKQVIDNIDNNFDFLRAYSPDSIRDLFLWTFRFMTLSTKHPAFHEEREWRIVYSPDFSPSTYIRSAVEVIHGVPQKVFKLRFYDKSVQDTNRNRFLDSFFEIIVGPTATPQPIQEAFTIELENIGVEHPSSKVQLSEIPFRR